MFRQSFSVEGNDRDQLCLALAVLPVNRETSQYREFQKIFEQLNKRCTVIQIICNQVFLYFVVSIPTKSGSFIR